VISDRTGTWGVRQSVRTLPLYDLDIPPVQFQLSDSTNPAGAPPAALRALQAMQPSMLSQYPTTYSSALRGAIAAYAGVDAAHVVMGCGSDELIDCAFRALVAPGGRVAFCDPTFVMARIFSVANALVPVPVPFAPAWEIDVAALVAAQPSLIYLCRPNNPTGTPFAWARLEELLQRFDGPVIVDEAYAEYSKDPVTPRAPSLDRVLSLRTLSKAWGLAGLRVGYAVGSRELIGAIERVRGPFKLTAASERGALAAVQQDGDWMREEVEATLDRRARFVQALRHAGYAPLPSHTNFLLVPVANAMELAEELLRVEVAVRPFRDLPVVGDALRITVGPDEAVQRIVDVLSRARD